MIKKPRKSIKKKKTRVKRLEISKRIKISYKEFTPLPREKILGFFQPSQFAFSKLYLIGIIFILLTIIPYVGIIFLLIDVLVIILTFFYVRGHKYWITTKRIVIVKTFIQRNIREIEYGKITDIALEQGILGRIFNFGTIIPITPSTLGTGSIIYTDAFGRIVKSTVEAETQSRYSIYGVKNPMKIRDLINLQLEKYTKK